MKTHVRTIYYFLFSRRDMCASEDVEVQTSALKIRDEVEKKSNCCSR